MSPSRARIAVIGSGWWGTEYHLPGILAHPDAELVAICDTRPERLQKAAETFSPRRTYTDYKNLLANEALDGVVIVTPHATHYPIARGCQQCGLHLLVEKPMTLHAWEARDLVQTAQQRKLELVVGYPFHYLPQTLRARQVVQSGDLGAVQYVNCSFASNVIGFLQGKVSPENPPHGFTVQGPGEDYNRPELLGGGEGHLQITHTAALMLFISGLQVEKVQAVMQNYGLAVDLVDAMSIQFKGQAVGSLGGTANAGSAYNVHLSIYCENGAYHFDSLAQHAAVHKTGESPEKLPSSLQGEQPYVVTRNFINLILGREESGSPVESHSPGGKGSPEESRSPAETGWRTVELLEAAYRSATEDGRPVKVEELYSD